MNFKFFLPVLAASLAITSCTKEGTQSTSMNTVVDSATVPQQDSAVVNGMEMDSMQNNEPITYVSNDGKTTFTMVYDASTDIATVKNVTDGKTYTMKPAKSASGEKYMDADGYYFWGHQGEFYFGKDEKELISGKRK